MRLKGTGIKVGCWNLYSNKVGSKSKLSLQFVILGSNNFWFIQTISRTR